MTHKKMSPSPAPSSAPKPVPAGVWTTLKTTLPEVLGQRFLLLYIMLAVFSGSALIMLLLGQYLWHEAFFKPVAFAAPGVFLSLLVLFLGVGLVYEDYPRASEVMVALAFAVPGSALFAMIFLSAALLSPFPLHDARLVYWDAHYFHFSIDAFHLYCLQHLGWGYRFFVLIYDSWHVLIFTPFVYFALKKKPFSLPDALFVLFFTTWVAYMVFYFVPVAGSSYGFPLSRHLPHAYRVLGHARILMRHGIEVSDLGAYGVVSLPSCHVIGGMLTAYFFFHQPIGRWFWMLWAALISLSTLVLGQHYLVDVLAGWLVFAGGVPVAHMIIRRFNRLVNAN